MHAVARVNADGPSAAGGEPGAGVGGRAGRGGAPRRGLPARGSAPGTSRRCAGAPSARALCCGPASVLSRPGLCAGHALVAPRAPLASPPGGARGARWRGRRRGGRARWCAARAGRAPPPPPTPFLYCLDTSRPSPRTNWTRLVLLPVLTGHGGQEQEEEAEWEEEASDATGEITEHVGYPPPPRTKWTRRVPHPVLIGHAAAFGRDHRACRRALAPPRPFAARRRTARLSRPSARADA